MISRRRIRLCIIGPLLGGHQNWVTSQGEVLATFLQRRGYEVKMTSHVRNRIARLFDILFSLLKWSGDIDVVILMVFSGKAFVPVDLASLVARWLGKPVILWFHGGNLPEFVKTHPVWAQRVFARGEICVSPSRYLADQLGHMTPSIRVIPNIIEVDDYPYIHRDAVRPRLLWMRTFHSIYNPHLAINVLNRVRKHFPDVTLTMAGQEKGLLGEVKEYARELGVSGRIVYPGFLDRDAKLKAFQAHDIFLNTNHVDNMPVSVIEACASGLPVVATRVGGIPYLITDLETGMLVPDDDPDAMAAAVTRLVSEPDLAANISSNARELAEQSSWEAVLPLWEKMLANLGS